MKKMLVITLAALIPFASAHAEYKPYFENPQQETGGSLIAIGVMSLIGAGLAARQASIMHHKYHAQLANGNTSDQRFHHKAGLYAGATTIGLVAGILCLGVGFSIRFD